MDNLAGVYTFNRVYQNTQWHVPVQNFRILNQLTSYTARAQRW